ncbi:MAG: nitrate reductase subunit alpha [Anaerolineales bacterium]|nr:nitrate reductase subunit alpha [Anaerolineales bacterium]
MKWIKDKESSAERKWEEFYRNRFQHDKRVRTTHGVNCTGSCSWEVFVKDGIVTWELQATDYPELEEGLPPYEPRGCQRGISFSWYLYSPLRVKYPYVRGALIDQWRRARKTHDDPVAAWEALVSDPAGRKKYQQARGKGGFRRLSWEEALDIIAASVIHTAKKYGPDRVAGFSPIPAMSQISYASGSRFLSLLGGVILSFYDWYCDLPPASPEIWGEQTDVHESADWYNSRFIAVMGSNLNMTRTPDTHFATEVRHAGAKLTVFSPDFSQIAKHADYWIPTHAGQDSAFWMAVNHVILQEFYVQRQVPYFTQYLKTYSDMPFLIQLKDDRPGRYLRAGSLEPYQDVENKEWKLLVWDEKSGRPRMPRGTIGFRWEEKDNGNWNLEMKDGATGENLDPVLSFLDIEDETRMLEFDDFTSGGKIRREVPVRYVETGDGRVPVTTVYDLMMAQFGISRGLEGDYPADYADELPYTPAWQEKYTGIHRDTCVRFAREWAVNAEKTKGKNMVIIGAGVNHWYHNNLVYRSAIVSLMLTGSVGVNGGGLAHYVGQEKVVNGASWGAVAFAKDWGMVPRQQNTPSFHYVHTDQWRYERGYSAYDPTASEDQTDHTIDHQVRAVRKGWLPFFPQFNENPLETVQKAKQAGGKDEASILSNIVDRLQEGDLEFAVEDPDAPENWPRTWFIWRGNAIGTSAKGHEYFLKHYLGTHSGSIAEEMVQGKTREIKLHELAPEGKMDLVVDLNFRMDTSALYSDIILPAASWYEKDDLNTTDLHSFINPMQAAVPTAWESKSDWDIFKAVARRVSDLAADHFPEPFQDVIMSPLTHDSPDELAQPHHLDWKTGEIDPLPGKSMPHFKIIERDYHSLGERFVSLGRGIEENGIGVHGLNFEVKQEYRDLLQRQPRSWKGEGKAKSPENGKVYPSLEFGRQVCDALLHLDPAANGEVAYRAFKVKEKKTGLKLADLAEGSRNVTTTFKDIVAQPRRFLTTPTWSGIINKGRAYSPFTLNVERLIPWRTLSGRQHFYLDHQGYLDWGNTSLCINRGLTTPCSMRLRKAAWKERGN